MADYDVGLAADQRSYGHRHRPPTRYRGPDRRGLITGPHPQPGLGFAVAGTLVVLLSLSVLAGVPMDALVARAGLPSAAVPGSTLPMLVLHLHAASFAVALLVGAMCFVRWWLLGDLV
ncbi:MAG: hypothetical protein ACOCT8_03670, partial [Actinomycetota bacterium]